MRSGLQSTSNRNYGAWVQSGNWVRYALDRPLVAEPGTDMDYSTGNTHLLSAILTKATGKSTWQFAQEVLAKPLGFSLAQWPRDPQGIYFGGNDMLMTPRQMVAFGELYLEAGQRARDARSSRRRGSTRRSCPRTRSRWSDQTYGYGWWMREMAGQDVHYRVGLRRPVHLRRAGPGSRRRHDLVEHRRRIAPEPPAHGFRHRRAVGNRAASLVVRTFRSA